MAVEPDPLVLALTTVPERETGERIAAALVEERLAACATLLPGATSVYRWEGAVQRETEVVMLLKTRRSRVAALGERLAALHPYTVPELVALPIEAGLEAYCRWVADETAGHEGTGGGPAPASTTREHGA